MNAASLRSRIMAERRALSPQQIADRSQNVVRRFFSLAALSPKTWKELRVGLYQALPSELSLLELEKQLIAKQTRLFFPRIIKSGKSGQPAKNREIDFVEIAPDQILSGENAHQAWQAGPYGIQEPHPDLPAIDPKELDLIVVPGVAFGKNGERIGMGAGYYDRFLARVPNLLRVVLALDFQLLERIEQQEWDQPVDWIVTESDEIRNDRTRAWLAEKLAQKRIGPKPIRK